MAKPDYYVLATVDASREDSALVRIGAAWKSETRDGGNPYIAIVLSARPWGEWDGKLQLHPIDH